MSGGGGGIIGAVRDYLSKFHVGKYGEKKEKQRL